MELVLGPGDGSKFGRVYKPVSEAVAEILADAREERTMATRCKFKCHEETKRVRYTGRAGEAPSFLYDYKFGAVSDGSAENKAFFDATPSGQLTVGTVKACFFEVGKEYYIDISEATDPAQAAMVDGEQRAL